MSRYLFLKILDESCAPPKRLFSWLLEKEAHSIQWKSYESPGYYKAIFSTINRPNQRKGDGWAEQRGKKRDDSYNLQQPYQKEATNSS